MITAENWRGQGATKYRILAAVQNGAQTVDEIWRATNEHDVRYGAITSTLAHAKRNGLVECEGERMRYRYRLTIDGSNYLYIVRQRFRK